MTKTFLALVLLTTLLSFTNLETITGKWKIDQATLSTTGSKLSPEQTAMTVKMVKKLFVNTVFDFKADHSFTATPGLPSMPKNLKWEYNAATGFISVYEANAGKSRVMEIIASEKNGKVIFKMQETPLVLDVHKL
ncbi:MAG: hypothetical protein EOP54_17530 [Sphingobacteriales bacterium]|nr:MAG: hypothetical protein EOP54_17530 [Sphingobacteriales bacterium]